MAAARAQFGCVGCSVTTHVGRHVGVEYIEEWSSEADLLRELQSDRFTTLAALMEPATEPPFVEFCSRTRHADSTTSRRSGRSWRPDLPRSVSLAPGWSRAMHGASGLG